MAESQRCTLFKAVRYGIRVPYRKAKKEFLGAEKLEMSVCFRPFDVVGEYKRKTHFTASLPETHNVYHFWSYRFELFVRIQCLAELCVHWPFKFTVTIRLSSLGKQSSLLYIVRV